MRDINIDESETGLNENDLKFAEENIGFSVPQPIADLYRTVNGGHPDRCFFNDGRYESEINRLIPLEREGRIEADYMVGIYRSMTDAGHLPKGHLPFGEDSGGNFYLIDPADERVWYMPMDEWQDDESAEQNWARSGRTLTYGFEAFMDALVEEDI